MLIVDWQPDQAAGHDDVMALIKLLLGDGAERVVVWPSDVDFSQPAFDYDSGRLVGQRWAQVRDEIVVYRLEEGRVTNVNTDSELILEEAGDDGFALASSIERFLPAQLSSADLAEIRTASQATGTAKFDLDVASSLPGADSRPCYRVYEHTCGPDHSWPAGVYYHFLGKSSAKEPPALRDVRICCVLKAVAIVRNRQGGEFGLLLNFRDRLGVLKQRHMPLRFLAGRGDELQKALFDQGLDIHYPQRNRLAEYLSQQQPDRTIWITSTPGWFDNVYVLPDRSIGDSTDAVLLQSEGNTNSNLYRQAGTLSAWQQQVAGLCPGNPFLLLMVSLAFCGPLLAKGHLDSLAIHIYGPSSQGKTSGMQVAASVWMK